MVMRVLLTYKSNNFYIVSKYNHFGKLEEKDTFQVILFWKLAFRDLTTLHYISERLVQLIHT